MTTNTQSSIILTPTDPVLVGKYSADADTVLAELDSTNGAFAVYLPDAKTTMNREFMFKNIGPNAVTITTVLGQLIDGVDLTHTIVYRGFASFRSNRISRWILLG